jgi:hypothetical protein
MTKHGQWKPILSSENSFGVTQHFYLSASFQDNFATRFSSKRSRLQAPRACEHEEQEDEAKEDGGRLRCTGWEDNRGVNCPVRDRHLTDRFRAGEVDSAGPDHHDAERD